LKKSIEEEKAAEAAAATSEGGDDLEKQMDEEDKKKDKAKTKKKGDRSKDEDSNSVRVRLSQDLPGDKVDFWLEMITRTYRSHVTLITEPVAGETLKQKLVETEVWAMRGVVGSTYVGIFYSYAGASESTIRPDKRSPPYQDEHARKVIHAMLEGRSGTGAKTISPGDMFILNDNAKWGLAGKMMNLSKWACDVPADGAKKALRTRIGRGGARSKQQGQLATQQQQQ